MSGIGEIKVKVADSQKTGFIGYKNYEVQWLIEQCDLAQAAVAHLLRRIGEDPGGVGYHAGFATEVFERAVRAYARYTDRDEESVRDEVLKAQDYHRDDEQELRMLRRRLDAGHCPRRGGAS